MDVLTESSYNAAHLYVSSARSQHAALLPSRGPKPTLKSVFEVVTDGKVYYVKGSELQKWILKRREELTGPKGALFKQRPTLEK